MDKKQGHKSEGEKFAGGYYTTSIEAFIPSNGRAIQAATSHCLGQNFSKMFNIQYEDDSNEMVHVWQNSWGLTTRTIGILIMVHGDNRGLVLPPRVAPIQVVIIPIFFKDLSSEIQDQLVQCSKSIYQLLRTNKIRTHLDDRPQYSPGFKFNHWELKGIPIRIEIGPKDLSTNSVVVVRRDNLTKTPINISNLLEFLSQQLEDIQKKHVRKSYHQKRR